MKKFWKSEMETDFVFSIFFLNSLHSKDAEKPLTTYLKLFLKKDTKSYFCPKYLYGALSNDILGFLGFSGPERAKFDRKSAF